MSINKNKSDVQLKNHLCTYVIKFGNILYRFISCGVNVIVEVFIYFFFFMLRREVTLVIIDHQKDPKSLVTFIATSCRPIALPAEQQRKTSKALKNETEL